MNLNPINEKEHITSVSRDGEERAACDTEEFKHEEIIQIYGDVFFGNYFGDFSVEAMRLSDEIIDKIMAEKPHRT